MSDSSDDDCPNYEWLSYSARPEWSDITPIAQDDGPNPVVAIAYTPKFSEVFDYIRAIIARGEKSERALALTKDALHLNPANYTVWQYRRDILKELNSDLYLELDYLDKVIEQNAKNYQVWHHRRVIVELLNDASKELNLTEEILNIDAKNYHAWQHRQWAIREFNLYDNELRFVDRLIFEDQRNNSAWNQRFFVNKHFGFTPDVIQRELQYTMNYIRLIKSNESAWNYLVGVLRNNGDGKLNSNTQVVEFCEELYRNGIRSPYLLAFLIDLYQEQCLNNESLHFDLERQANVVYTLCSEMAKKFDVIRRKYWQYVSDAFKAQLEPIMQELKLKKEQQQTELEGVEQEIVQSEKAGLDGVEQTNERAK